jgi:hypothetical protein
MVAQAWTTAALSMLASGAWVLLGMAGGTRADALPIVALASAFLVSRMLPLKLPRGDEIVVLALVAGVGTAFYGVRVSVVGCLIAGALDILGRLLTGGRIVLAARLPDLLRQSSILVLSGAVCMVVIPGAESWRAGEMAFLWAGTFGLTYTFLDLLSLAVIQSAAVRGRLLDTCRAMLERLLSTYLVHIAMAGVVLRVHGALGAWGFWMAVPLTLVLQNGFSTYLRMRRAYSETIASLAAAAELDREEDAGHSKRVADLTISVGRRMGFAGQELQDLGYAAMLHDIGRIGLEDEAEVDNHAARGAEILESIPFLRGAAQLVAHHHETGADTPIGAVIIGVCSEYDRARRQDGVEAAIAMVSAYRSGAPAAVAEALKAAVWGAVPVVKALA